MQKNNSTLHSIGRLLNGINPIRWVNVSLNDLRNYFYLLKVISRERGSANWNSHSLRANGWGKILKVVNVPSELQSPDVIQNSPQGISAQMGYSWIPDAHMIHIQKEMSPVIDDYFLRLNLHQILIFEIKRHPEPDTYAYLYYMRFNWRMLTWLNLIKLGIFLGIVSYLQIKFGALTWLWDKIANIGG